MSEDDYIEKDVGDKESIQNFVETITNQKNEMVLTSKGRTVGAILTAEQYSWFLDQLDAAQDTSFINERTDDLEGTQSLENFKKELGK